MNAQALGKVVDRVVHRISADNGPRLTAIAVTTIQNVSKAVIAIAVVQAALGTIAFFLVGLPFVGLWAAALLGAALMTLPILVIVPSIVYVWSVSSTTTALLFTAFILPVMLIDNVFRPILAAKGLPTPMIIVFVGVIGGAMSLGMIGLFVGPIFLAVFYEMLMLWTESQDISPTEN